MQQLKHCRGAAESAAAARVAGAAATEATGPADPV